jgi:hypothetical protein
LFVSFFCLFVWLFFFFGNYPQIQKIWESTQKNTTRESNHLGHMTCLWSQINRGQIPALPLTSSVTGDKNFHLCEPQFHPPLTKFKQEAWCNCSCLYSQLFRRQKSRGLWLEASPGKKFLRSNLNQLKKKYK